MAVRVSWWFVLITVIGLSGLYSMVFANPEAPVFSGAASVVALALMLFVIWGASLISVVWHRYILLEEIPQGVIPYRSGLNIWTYFWYGVGIGIIILVVAMVAMVFLGFVLFPDTPIKTALYSIITTAIMSILFYRLALILPAVALGNTLTLGDAMQATRSALGAIFVLTLASVTFGFLIGFALNQLVGLEPEQMLFRIVDEQVILTGASGAWFIYAIAEGAVQWFLFMLGVSILTTLYGHFIEKRSLG